MFVEGGGGRLCHGTMAQWPVQAWMSSNMEERNCYDTCPICSRSYDLKRVGYYLTCLAYQMAQSKGVYWHLYFSALSSPWCYWKNCDLGIPIQSRDDGSIINLRRLQVRTKTIPALVRDLLYADDCTLLAHTLHDAQQQSSINSGPLQLVLRLVWRRRSH